MLTVLIILIGLALIFDFINGFHDAANSVATIIATQVLKPWQALIWAAMFNFLAFFIFPLTVAATIGKGIVDPSCINNASIAAALVGAISFNLLTWYFKLPSSSSHALIGALMGVGLAQAGWHGLNWHTLNIVFASVFFSPIIGAAVAYVLIQFVPRLPKEEEAEKVLGMQRLKFYKFLQLSSSALMSLGHGGNDAQKTMGIITVLLYANGYAHGNFHVPFWVVLTCYSVIALGTLSGGWRIIETVGYKLTKLKPPSGACAEFGAAATLFLANRFGIPISTTHVLTGAIVGVSSYNQEKFQSWKLLKKIFAAWIFTFPAAAATSAFTYMLIKHL
jgi:PiT family inorganic phosphate transporter